ncbi:MAG: hypothetical protein UHD09_06980 [Bifidobacterium sp.]|nr:hypothetical protein [Bifidobacterium sp.]
MSYTGTQIERTLLSGGRRRKDDPYALKRSAKTPGAIPSSTSCP